MYILFIVLIIIASIILILAVLSQNPKGGMAANFGASNQVMGARQTADFLEKLTWGLSIAIVVLSLCATMAMPLSNVIKSNSGLNEEILRNTEGNEGISPFELPTTGPTTPTEGENQTAE